ncbi:MAG: T9SS C-terminal target domain-containing protein, partial [Bacteroidetes bacterium]
PNPFNPQTTIEFRLDRPQAVRLAVYDVLGREVAVLAEGAQPAGVFRVTFDATGLSSGLYLYRLQTEAGVLSRTMTLVK